MLKTRIFSLNKWVVLVGWLFLASTFIRAQEKPPAPDGEIIATKTAPADSMNGNYDHQPNIKEWTGCDACAECKEQKGILGNRPVRIFPRMGNSPIPPKGPGYYSAWDWLTGHCRKDRPKFPYSPLALMPKSFFDSDFRYLDSASNKQHHFTDPLHQIHLGDKFLFSTGGDLRWRYMHEVNSRLTGRDNFYDLLRTRVYADLWFQDKARAYVEFIDAHIFNNELAPLPIDVNRTDLLNAFVDIKIGCCDDKPIYARVGRQELLLGSQRLLSPLEWANTRRTFEGARISHQGKKFDFDVFWMQAVIPDPSNVDRVDYDRHFGGAWFTYRPKKGHFFDLYYLFLDDDSPRPLLGQPLGIEHTVHTGGLRYAGDKCNFLWDVELAMQVGQRGNDSLLAGAASVGGGRHFPCLPMTPTVWIYYDYASGTDNPDAPGQFNTFNQMFPFGHFYLGWLDLVGRQNIHDINGHVFFYPTKWITVWLQYHHFELARERDALYNAGGVPIRRDPTGNSGTNVGDEVDFIVNFHVGANTDIMLGYSRLFAGNFIKNTGPGNDPEFFFMQYNFRW